MLVSDLQQLRFRVPPEAVEAVANLLAEQGHGVEVRDDTTLTTSDKGTVELYLWLPGSQVRARVDAVETLLSSLADMDVVQASTWTWHAQDVDPQDWAEVYKAFFPVLHLGGMVVIKPTWKTYDPRPHERVVEMDPGMAFGTGLHASTALAVELLERLARNEPVNPHRVIDLGAGTGILGLVAAKLWPECRVQAVEVDPVAADVCRKNVAANDLSDRINVHAMSITDYRESPPALPVEPVGAEDDTPPHGIPVPRGGPGRGNGLRSMLGFGNTPTPAFRPSSLVLANLTAELLLTHRQRICQLLRDTGHLVLSGLLAEKTPEVVAAFAEPLRLEPEVTLEREGWRAVLMRTRP